MMARAADHADLTADRPSGWDNGAGGGVAVVPLDQTEYDRWWRSAESSLLMARLGAEHEQHHHACLHAEQAARQAVKGLLFAVGAGGRARGHNLSL